MWNNFAYPNDQHPYAESDETPPEAERFLEHVFDIICRGDPALYEYVMKWCASVYQYPEHKISVALFLSGGQGCGKGAVQ
jgi:hypothetical protein